MPKKIYHVCISFCLVLFFLMAVLMTFVSHRNYLANCIPVEILENTTSESLTITQSCFAEGTLGNDGAFTFHWNDDEVYEKVQIGDRIRVDVGNRIVPAEIINRYEIDGERTFTAQIDTLLGDILMEQPFGFIVSASYKGPSRAYVIPASCVTNTGGSYQVAVATETAKAWGTAYTVHYETIQVHEINEEKCSLKGLPIDGAIIYSSNYRLWEGADILITE